ncbi:PLP-dependent aminotransferase family protein [Marinobacterium sediminicola]|uniref:DNA-binding transcriptional regulator, MocR family, contains an aminotransferase domain n=1 Tax=Marinobacterium sediminicola TaxID=518898 RepID=A0ABY1RXH1_9GAMM|nr:PLP-dependent aminotransferase family protein [Marinobacterium sediminicola]ULG67774.1 PLP-dependent aminotransferase family protein [Marinobacterium sediminicola]SMR71573.1 DNA-binding transcriptional regulator, MocR family, contains an aminotransferase domain [Marinobacterium sediminicola]
MTYRYQQLEKWILQGIRDQRWPPGERLPSIRELCEYKQLSKATVMHALQRLEAQGILEARPKSGYYVTHPANTPSVSSRIAPPRPVTVSDLLLDIMQRSAAFDLLPMLNAGDLPVAMVSLNRCIGRALRRQKGSAHQYYDQPAGDAELRKQLALHAARRGWSTGRDQLCITSGCQHALFLALMACCEPGDVIAVEAPGFYGVLQLLQQLGLKAVEVPTTIDSGMDPEALEQVLTKWKVRACVLSPAFSTPSGALMPEQSRRRILELASRHDMAVIEDDIYADTGFTETPPPIKALDTEERVILCSSFSKSLSRDLRLGWISGARWHERIQHLKLVTQLASSRYLQQGVAEFMADGGYASHLRRQRSVLSARRDQLMRELSRWPHVQSFSRPAGGLASWVEFSPDVDVLAMYHQALKQGVVLTPGPLFSVSGQYRNCLRISFAHPWDEKRLEALAKVPQLIRHAKAGPIL